jgi:hypothetical protein
MKCVFNWACILQSVELSNPDGCPTFAPRFSALRWEATPAGGPFKPSCGLSGAVDLALVLVFEPRHDKELSFV